MADTLTLTPTISSGSTSLTASDFDIETTRAAGNVSESGVDTNIFKDTNLTDEALTYNITITPKDSAKDKISTDAISVQITGELSKSESSR